MIGGEFMYVSPSYFGLICINNFFIIKMKLIMKNDLSMLLNKYDLSTKKLFIVCIEENNVRHEKYLLIFLFLLKRKVSP